jgi:hypothetical protein
MAMTPPSARRADAEQLSDEKPEIEGAAVDQQPLQNVRVPLSLRMKVTVGINRHDDKNCKSRDTAQTRRKLRALTPSLAPSPQSPVPSP